VIVIVVAGIMIMPVPTIRPVVRPAITVVVMVFMFASCGAHQKEKAQAN